MDTPFDTFLKYYLSYFGLIDYIIKNMAAAFDPLVIL